MQKATYQAPTVSDLKKQEIPEELKEKMKKYAAELRRKFPHMKPARIGRKVAEYFKVKLV